jgi:hypothetical protein
MRMQLLTHIPFSLDGVCKKKTNTQNNTLPLYRGIAEMSTVWLIQTMGDMFEVNTPR